MPRPRMLMCYLCGREYGTASLSIHIPQCQKKWQDAENQKPKHERRTMPKPPKELDTAISAGGAPMSAAQIDAMNEQAFHNYNEESLTRCPHCFRTFSDTAMKHHQRACTADNPAKPAGTGLGPAALSSKLAHLDSKVAGTNPSYSRSPVNQSLPPEAYRQQLEAGDAAAAVAAATASRPPPMAPAAPPRARAAAAGAAANSLDVQSLKQAMAQGRAEAEGGGNGGHRAQLDDTPAPAPPPPHRPSTSAAAARPLPTPSAQRPSSSGGGGGARTVTAAQLAGLAKAAGAWEIKQELMLNHPELAQEIHAAGSHQQAQLAQIAAQLGLRPNEAFAAFTDQSYLSWRVVQ